MNHPLTRIALALFILFAAYPFDTNAATRSNLLVITFGSLSDARQRFLSPATTGFLPSTAWKCARCTCATARSLCPRW
jgi:hypothetical protein